MNNLEVINAHSVVEEIKTEGHSPLKIFGSDYKTYVAKNAKGHNPAYSLINECLCDLFLQLWSIETPSTSIINIEWNLINEDLVSSNHQKHYYDLPCFGSEWVQNAFDMNDSLISFDRKGYNRILNPLDVLRIGLFDLWVENDDRKPTNYNLVLKPSGGKYKVLPIDNAFTFSTMGYNSLRPLPYLGKSNDHLFVSKLGKLIKQYSSMDQEKIKIEKDYFYICLDKCQTEFDNVLDQISAFFPLEVTEKERLQLYLFNSERNNKVFEEYVYWLTT